MERKLKVLATQVLVDSMTLVDRFSDLPDVLAYRIFSLLTMRDLTCFGIASKRCRELYPSTPSLELSDFLPKTTPTGEFRWFSRTTCEFRLKLLSSLDRFLLQSGDNRINYFGIFWNGHYDQGRNRTPCSCVNVRSQIIDWIHNAVGCNVEVLRVSSNLNDLVEEPSAFHCGVFLCATLRSLYVNMDGTVVKTPSVSFSSNIEYLELINVDIEAGGFFKWISCSCKFITELIALFREGSTHVQFDHLLYLRLDLRSFSDDIIPAVVSLLRGFHKLCTLYIMCCVVPSFLDRPPDVSGFDKEYWKLQNLDFIDQIQEVTIVLDGSNNGIDFARYILEHAKNLDQMDIQYLLDQSDDAIPKLNESKEMSKATVIFEEGFEEDSDENSVNFGED